MTRNFGQNIINFCIYYGVIFYVLGCVIINHENKKPPEIYTSRYEKVRINTFTRWATQYLIVWSRHKIKFMVVDFV